MKFTLIGIEDDGSKHTSEFECAAWANTFQPYLSFLRGCGYVIDHNVGLVEDLYDTEPETCCGKCDTQENTESEVVDVSFPGTRFDVSGMVGNDGLKWPETTDAHVWASEFKLRFPDSDVGTMIGWFANAIEFAKQSVYQKPCCGTFETCNEACVTRADHYKEKCESKTYLGDSDSLISESVNYLKRPVSNYLDDRIGSRVDAVPYNPLESEGIEP